MIILEESNKDQTFKFIGRKASDSPGYVKFYDKQTNEEFAYQVTLTPSNNYTSVTDTFGDLKKDHTYYVLIQEGDLILQEVYRGICFCVDDVTADYSINTGNYTERTTTNEWTVYE